MANEQENYTAPKKRKKTWFLLKLVWPWNTWINAQKNLL